MIIKLVIEKRVDNKCEYADCACKSANAEIKTLGLWMHKKDYIGRKMALAIEQLMASHGESCLFILNGNPNECCSMTSANVALALAKSEGWSNE